MTRRERGVAGGLQIREEVRGHGEEVIIPERSVPRGFTRGIPQDHLHFREPADWGGGAGDGVASRRGAGAHRNDRER
jgi:hypothetical protein